MAAFANSLTTNLFVTVLVLLMVFILPWADRKICGHLKLNLQGGLSDNARAESLLRARQGVLYMIFGLYLAADAYLVFFSRSAAQDYQVHIALYEDLQNAVQIDLGFLGLLRAIVTEGFSSALSHVQVVRAQDITQVYMNIMLYVPMGYLLPYLFSWFRARVRIRPVLACFVISFATENLQLITRRGFYDADDLISNTIGGLIGQVLFLSIAYVVTHPDWRNEMKAYRKWKRHARARTLYPFARKIGLTRTTLLATREEDIWFFYNRKLGFRAIRQLVPMNSSGTDILMQMGRMQLEFHCSNLPLQLPLQTLTLSVTRLNPVIRRLKMSGIDVSAPEQDPYTGLRCVHFYGPDQVRIVVIEK